MTTEPEPLQRNAELTALLRLSQTALRGLPLQAVVDCALDQIMTVIAPDHTFLYLLTGKTLLLAGTSPPGQLALPGKKGFGQCLCGLAASLTQPVFSRDIHRDDRCTLHECKEAGVRSFAALPLTADGELLGVLGVASLRDRNFPAQQNLLESLADAAALALNNILIREALQQTNQKLTDQLADRTAELTIRGKELERLNRLFVDREFRIKSLKDRLKTLEGRQ